MTIHVVDPHIVEGRHFNPVRRAHSFIVQTIRLKVLPVSKIWSVSLLCH